MLACSVAFAVAMTTHINVEAVREVHPSVALECETSENTTANLGKYLNSNNVWSHYATLEHTFDNNFFVEGGLVTGYLDTAIPYGRVGYKPAGTSTVLFIAPAVSADRTKIGSVVGVQFKF